MYSPPIILRVAAKRGQHCNPVWSATIKAFSSQLHHHNNSSQLSGSSGTKNYVAGWSYDSSVAGNLSEVWNVLGDETCVS